MANLADAGNTWNHALQCLADDGYRVRAELVDEEGFLVERQRTIWYARRLESGKEIELAADDPLALLGLSVIWSRWGDKWREVNIRDWWEEILSR